MFDVAVRYGCQLYFFGGGAGGGFGFGLTVVVGFFGDTASASLSLFAGDSIGSFAMDYVLSGCSGHSMNSTISTSPVGIRMAATPSAGIRLSFSNHTPSAIRK